MYTIITAFIIITYSTLCFTTSFVKFIVTFTVSLYPNEDERIVAGMMKIQEITFRSDLDYANYLELVWTTVKAYGILQMEKGVME